jgi:MazG family protein
MSSPNQPDPSPGAVPGDDPRLLGLRQILWVMDQLRSPAGGCPWDLEQTPASLRGYLLEETYELLEALDPDQGPSDTEQSPKKTQSEAICEELGDLLFQVVFHARIAEDEGRFDLGDAASGIARKLFRRHPHVFSEGQASDAGQVMANWQELKKREGRRSVMDGVPRELPALLRSQRLQEKAAAIGFDWKDPSGPLAKVREEIAELEVEIARADATASEAELGDLLFSVVNLARHLKIDAEAALRGAAARFASRFRQIEAGGGDLRALGAEELERRWEAAKAREG